METTLIASSGETPPPRSFSAGPTLEDESLDDEARAVIAMDSICAQLIINDRTNWFGAIAS